MDTICSTEYRNIQFTQQGGELGILKATCGGMRSFQMHRTGT